MYTELQAIEFAAVAPYLHKLTSTEQRALHAVIRLKLSKAGAARYLGKKKGTVQATCLRALARVAVLMLKRHA